MDILDISNIKRLDLLLEHMIIPIQKKYFHRDYRTIMPWPLVPNDYKGMMEDKEFYSVCTEMAYRQTRDIEKFKAFNIKSKRIVDQINAELKELK